MEVEKKEVEVTENSLVTKEVKMPTEADKKAAIEKANIDKRNEQAEKDSRIQGFLAELQPLIDKWNVQLLSRMAFVGAGNQILSQEMNVVIQANNSKENQSVTSGNNG